MTGMIDLVPARVRLIVMLDIWNRVLARTGVLGSEQLSLPDAALGVVDPALVGLLL